MDDVNEDRLRHENVGVRENHSNATPKEDSGSRRSSQVDSRPNVILEYLNRLYRDYPLIVFCMTTFGTALVFILHTIHAKL
jgi:hypothetical protein